MELKQRTLGILRISMGWIFFWTFLDKTWGLGFATVPAKAWLAGASPTAGFLKAGTASSPLAGIFQSMVGQTWVDWLFMLGMLCIGLALLLGLGIKIACWSGVVMMALIYLAAWPVENNWFMDQHIIYILVLVFFSQTNVGHYWGLGRAWANTTWVRKYSWLK